MFCPFISTPTNKVPPSQTNCAECCFYLFEHGTSSFYCAINLAAERTVNITEMLKKAFPNTFH